MGNVARTLAAIARARVAEYEMMLEACQDGVHWPSGMTREEIATKPHEARRKSEGRDADVRRAASDT